MSDNAFAADLKTAFTPLGGLDGYRRTLLSWFREEARAYPWRGTSDPYAVLVSESMLQQTRISTVLERGYFVRWMRAFPDWAALAHASVEEVLKGWEGLGYYNRARNLQRTAAKVVAEFGGRFPEDTESALALPGVGRYTAGAVLSIAFGKRTAVVDGNVARVFSRVFALDVAVNTPEGQRRLWSWAETLVPYEAPGDYNAALMELGQRLCRPVKPTCEECPLHVACRAFAAGAVTRYPLKRRGPGITAKEERVVLAEQDGRIFLRPETGARRRGLWRLPEVSGEEVEDWEELFRFDYPITRYRVTLRVFRAPATWIPAPAEVAEGGWFRRDSALPPLGAPYRKALDRHRDATGEEARLL
mgnify:CR=1 FL=1